MPKHTICSDLQLGQLFRFIADTDSDPEHAMLLALILFYGATTEELAFAQLDCMNDALKIIFRRKPASHKTKARRPQKLTLPKSPKWFLKLQQRFYQEWLQRYQLVKKTYPRKPLFTYPNFNRSVSREWIRRRIKTATEKACDHPIRGYVLRQTCAVMPWQRCFASYPSWMVTAGGVHLHLGTDQIPSTH